MALAVLEGPSLRTVGAAASLAPNSVPPRLARLAALQEQSLNYAAAGVGEAFQAAAQSANSYRRAMAAGSAPAAAREAAGYTPAQRRAAMGERDSGGKA